MAKKTETTPETTKTTQKAEVVQPLKVDITFPSIVNLKQALAFDADGNLLIKVQFTSKVDQYEIFRLINLLKQPHGGLYAIIGSPQSAMDFIFNQKQDRMDILKAASQLVAAKTDAKGNVSAKVKAQEEPAEPPDQEPKAVKIHGVAFNHIPEEEKPFGVVIDYLIKPLEVGARFLADISDGMGEIHTVAGRGKNATEAVLAGVAATNALSAEVKEPFEVIAALELLDPSPECYKLIRAIEAGNFDEVPSKGE